MYFVAQAIVVSSNLCSLDIQYLYMKKLFNKRGYVTCVSCDSGLNQGMALPDSLTLERMIFISR